MDILTTLIEAYEARHQPIPQPDKELNGLLDWLQSWCRSMCDDEWEFHEGVKLVSTSNPGWSVELNLKGTAVGEVFINEEIIEKPKNDWYSFLVGNGLFIGCGDPSKLTFLLTRFRNLVATGS